MRLANLLLIVFSVISAYSSTFTVDPARSTITLSGTASGIPLSQQAPGSLTTSVDGSLQITYTGTEIQVNDGFLDARTNGVWRPGIGAQAVSPADFGVQGPSPFGGLVYAAFREILVNAAGPVKAVSSSGEFDAASIIFSFPTNSNSTLDYDLGFLGKGSEKLGGTSTNLIGMSGTIGETNGILTVTFSIDTTFRFSVSTPDDTNLRIKGTIVATSAEASEPRITAVEIVNGQFKITAVSTTATMRLEGATNLHDWSPRNPTITTVDSSTRVYSVPASSQFEFFRLVE